MADTHYASLWTFTAGEDLDDFAPGRGSLFKAVALDDGKLANNGVEADGILVCGGREGEDVTIGYAGEIRFIAGGPVGAGKRLTVVSSGYIAEAATGDYVVGRCLGTAVSSGSVGTGMFNFPIVAYMGNSR